MLSASIQEYLKAIYDFEQVEGAARTSLLANRLGIAPASVTGMLKRLSAEDPALIEYSKHRAVRLTLEGRVAAERLVRRQQLAENFLSQVLEMDGDELEPEAQRLGHIISDRLERRLSEFMEDGSYYGRPMHDSEIAAGVPELEGFDDLQDVDVTPAKIEQADTEDALSEDMLLAEAELDVPLAFKGFKEKDSELEEALVDFGIGENSRLHILQKYPFDGPLSVRVINGVIGQTHTIDHDLAIKLCVKPLG